MIRSLLAILAAVIIGLTAAKFVEGAGLGLVGEAGWVSPSVDEGAGSPKLRVSAPAAGVLALSWFVAAFASSAVALLLGRRWSPLGWLAAATVAFNAGLTLLPVAAPFWLWPAGLGAAAAGGLVAVRLLRARQAPPPAGRGGGLFR